MELLMCVEECAQMKLSCAYGAEANASAYRKMGTKLKVPGNKQEKILVCRSSHLPFIYPSCSNTSFSRLIFYV